MEAVLCKIGKTFALETLPRDTVTWHIHLRQAYSCWHGIASQTALACRAFFIALMIKISFAWRMAAAATAAAGTARNIRFIVRSDKT